MNQTIPSWGFAFWADAYSDVPGITNLFIVLMIRVLFSHYLHGKRTGIRNPITLARTRPCTHALTLTNTILGTIYSLSHLHHNDMRKAQGADFSNFAFTELPRNPRAESWEDRWDPSKQFSKNGWMCGCLHHSNRSINEKIGGLVG